MSTYHLRGTDREGRSRVERVQAPSASAALEGMRQRGYREVELLTGDIEAAIRPTDAPGMDRPAIPPEEEMELQRGGLGTFVWVTFRKSALWILLPVGFLALRRWSGRPPGLGDAVLVALAAAPIALAFAIRQLLVAPYERLLRAGSFARWEEVLARLGRIERGMLGKLIPRHELVIRRARALIGLGRAEEALALVRSAEEVQPGMEPWLFDLRVADLHLALLDTEAARACFERAVAAAPGKAEAHLAMAEFLASHHVRDASGARRALAPVRELPLAATSAWALHRTEGMIAVEEGRLREAVAILGRARAGIRSLPPTSIRDGADAVACAYLAIALAGSGDASAARAPLARAERLLGHFEQYAPLLHRAREAAG